MSSAAILYNILRVNLIFCVKLTLYNLLIASKLANKSINYNIKRHSSLFKHFTWNVNLIILEKNKNVVCCNFSWGFKSYIYFYLNP